MVQHPPLPPALRVCFAGFYAYGALVHLANMLGWTGIDWRFAPLKWQALDLIYLALDLAIVLGLWTGRRWAVPAVCVAALSQIALYTLLRDWILDVPAAVAISAADRAYLNGLVAFHIACLAVIGGVLWRHQLRSRRGARGRA